MRFQFQCDVRRKADLEKLARSLESLFRIETTIGDRDLDSGRVIQKRRGGEVDYWATVPELSRSEAEQSSKRIASAIRNNRNLIDRIDWFRVVVFQDDLVVAYSSDDFRGFMREIAMEEVK